MQRAFKQAQAQFLLITIPYSSIFTVRNLLWKFKFSRKWFFALLDNILNIGNSKMFWMMAVGIFFAIFMIVVFYGIWYNKMMNKFDCGLFDEPTIYFNKAFSIGNLLQFGLSLCLYVLLSRFFRFVGSPILY